MTRDNPASKNKKCETLNRTNFVGYASKWRLIWSQIRVKIADSRDRNKVAGIWIS
jgi:hypothetical protein